MRLLLGNMNMSLAFSSVVERLPSLHRSCKESSCDGSDLPRPSCILTFTVDWGSSASTGSCWWSRNLRPTCTGTRPRSGLIGSSLSRERPRTRRGDSWEVGLPPLVQIDDSDLWLPNSEHIQSSAS